MKVSPLKNDPESHVAVVISRKERLFCFPPSNMSKIGLNHSLHIAFGCVRIKHDYKNP